MRLKKWTIFKGMEGIFKPNCEECKLTSKNVPKMPFSAMEIFGHQFLARWILRHVLQNLHTIIFLVIKKSL